MERSEEALHPGSRWISGSGAGGEDGTLGPGVRAVRRCTLHAVSVRTVRAGRQTAAGAPQFTVMEVLGLKHRATPLRSCPHCVWRVWGLVLGHWSGRWPHQAVDAWEFSKCFQCPCFALVTSKRYQCAGGSKRACRSTQEPQPHLEWCLQSRHHWCKAKS